MSILSTIQTGKQVRPRRTLVYGTHGIGKSTFGAMSDAPVFIQTEDGLADIDCAKLPLCRSLQDTMDQLSALYSEKHDYKTVVIDSADWLERLIFADVCSNENVPSIEKVGYAKGYTYAIDRWRPILNALNALRDDRGMSSILIAHAQIQKFESPDTPAYDRYSPRLHKLASAMIQEWADEVFFASYKVFTVKVGQNGFTQEAKHIGAGSGERVLKTTERPGHLAKNRIPGLPDEIPMLFSAYSAYVRGEAK